MAPIAGRSIFQRDRRGAAETPLHGRQLPAAAASPHRMDRRVCGCPLCLIDCVVIECAFRGRLPELLDLNPVRILPDPVQIRQSPESH